MEAVVCGIIVATLIDFENLQKYDELKIPR